jgi:uncharacterized protein (DUF433 family)
MASSTVRQQPTPTDWPHITLNANGAACIDGTRFKVSTVIIDYTRNRLTPEQIQQNYPALSLAQVHAALLFYYDHKQELDEKLAAEDQYAEAMRAADTNGLTRSQLVQRLRDKKQTADPNMGAA